MQDGMKSYNKKAKNMKNYSFVIYLRNDAQDFDEIANNLIKNAGKKDIDCFIGINNGKLYLAYDREDKDLNSAIKNASLEALSANAVIDRIDAYDDDKVDEKQKSESPTYGEMAVMRGPEICAREIDRLQEKIVTAQSMVCKSSKVSSVLFLDKKNWGAASYADWWQDWKDFIESSKS